MSEQLMITGTPKVGATLTTNAPAGASIGWCYDGSGSSWCGLVYVGESFTIPKGAVYVKGIRAIALDPTFFATDALGISALFGPITASPVTPPPPPPSTTVPVGYCRVAIASAATWPDVALTARQESVVIVQAWNPDIKALKAANPARKVLIYFNFGAMTSGGVTDGLYPGLPLNGAYALQSEAGQDLHVKERSPMRDQLFSDLHRDDVNDPIAGYSTLWLADVGLAAYQQAWAQFAIAQCVATGADGVFADNTDLISSGASQPAKYLSIPAYQGAVKAGLQAVYPQLRTAGKLLVPNFGSWSSYSLIGNTWLPYVDGAMDEQLGKWGTVAGTGYRSAAGALDQVSEIQTAANAGKLFIGVTHSAAGDQAAATYGLALALLGTGGANTAYCFSSPPEYASETLPATVAAAAAKLGEPSGAYTYASGVASRAFAGGTVRVDMTTSPNPTATITAE